MRQWHYWTTLETRQIRVLYRPDISVCAAGVTAAVTASAPLGRSVPFSAGAFGGGGYPSPTTPFFHGRRCPLAEDRCAAVGGGKNSRPRRFCCRSAPRSSGVASAASELRTR